MGMQRLVVAVLMRVVQSGLFGMLLRMGGKSVGGVAVVGGLLVVAFFEVLSRRPVILQGVLKIVRGFFVGLNDFLVLFGMVSHEGQDSVEENVNALTQ